MSKKARRIPAPRAKKVRRIPSLRRKNVVARLLARDGNDCWYCGDELVEGPSTTIEHVVSRSNGGGNRIENLVLAHHRCNTLAGDRPVTEKLELRAEMRASREAPEQQEAA